jgi:hypothetical protein
MIQRSEYAAYIEKNKANITQKQHLYKNRKVIVEHPFGTIKRQWGFDYILTKKGRERASADVGLMFTAYNLRRIINIIGQNNLKEYLKKVLFAVFHSYKSLLRRASKLLRPEPKYGNDFSGSEKISLKSFFAVLYLGKYELDRGY